jgi:hypothetical protein
VGTKAGRRAARDRVSAYHQAQLAERFSHIGAAFDRQRGGETGAYAIDETIHHYHRAAAELLKFCFARGGGSHAAFTAGLLDRTTAGAEAIGWQERATPRRHQRSRPHGAAGATAEVMTDRGHSPHRLSAQSRPIDDMHRARLSWGWYVPARETSPAQTRDD